MQIDRKPVAPMEDPRGRAIPKAAGAATTAIGNFTANPMDAGAITQMNTATADLAVKQAAFQEAVQKGEIKKDEAEKFSLMNAIAFTSMVQSGLKSGFNKDGPKNNNKLSYTKDVKPAAATPVLPEAEAPSAATPATATGPEPLINLQALRRNTRSGSEQDSPAVPLVVSEPPLKTAVDPNKVGFDESATRGGLSPVQLQSELRNRSVEKIDSMFVDKKIDPAQSVALSRASVSTEAAPDSTAPKDALPNPGEDTSKKDDGAAIAGDPSPAETSPTKFKTSSAGTSSSTSWDSFTRKSKDMILGSAERLSQNFGRGVDRIALVLGLAARISAEKTRRGIASEDSLPTDSGARSDFSTSPSSHAAVDLAVAGIGLGGSVGFILLGLRRLFKSSRHGKRAKKRSKK